MKIDNRYTVLQPKELVNALRFSELVGETSDRSQLCDEVMQRDENQFIKVLDYLDVEEEHCVYPIPKDLLLPYEEALLRLYGNNIKERCKENFIMPSENVVCDTDIGYPSVCTMNGGISLNANSVHKGEVFLDAVIDRYMREPIVHTPDKRRVIKKGFSTMEIDSEGLKLKDRYTGLYKAMKYHFITKVIKSINGKESFLMTKMNFIEKKARQLAVIGGILEDVVNKYDIDRDGKTHVGQSALETSFFRGKLFKIARIIDSNCGRGTFRELSYLIELFAMTESDEFANDIYSAILNKFMWIHTKDERFKETTGIPYLR